MDKIEELDISEREMEKVEKDLDGLLIKLKEKKEKKRQLMKEWYDNNKEYHLGRMSEPLQCECGSFVSRCKMSRHYKSKKHMQFIDQKKLENDKE